MRVDVWCVKLQQCSMMALAGKAKNESIHCRDSQASNVTTVITTEVLLHVFIDDFAFWLSRFQGIDLQATQM